MTTGYDNAMIAKRLRTACTTRANNIRLPGSIAFTMRDTTVQMRLAPSCVDANMQDNSSSFEGWALALKRWLPDITKVELTWAFDGQEEALHYQRFLFRVAHFSSLFPSWFSIDAHNTDDLHKLRTNGTGPYVVNSPTKERQTKTSEECESLTQALRTEHLLECFITDHPEQLSRLFNLAGLDRQRPVGVFNRAVKSNNAIFPRGHSAIDLWGVSKTDLLLFELKTAGNIPIGIMSELFFYSHVMESVQKGRFNLEDANDPITKTKAVRAYILAPEWHPLIDAEVLRLTNDGFRNAGKTIRFGSVRIIPDHPQQYKVEMWA